jgi:hypothetical protein
LPEGELVTAAKREKFMANVGYRKRQLLISAIGALLIVPWGMFLGAMFTFSFRSNESPGAYAFDIITFWSQVAAILFSFLKPRIAAIWMLMSVGVSVLIGMGFDIQSSYAPNAYHLNAAQWIATLPGTTKIAATFWGLPIIFALLLLKVSSSAQSADVRPEPDPLA